MTIKKLLAYLKSNEKILLLAIVSAASLVLLGIRCWRTTHLDFIFMVWNLFLAWVPLFFIKLVWELEKRKPAPLLLLSIYLTIWLLFFPNAPYLITDIKHLRGVSEHMIWYDSLMLFLFAFSGFLTGLYSIRIVFRILAYRWQGNLVWFMVGAAMLLSSFGIYLGRYERFNSWDILTRPSTLARGILDSAQDPLAIKHTFAFSFVLMLLYFAFHFFVESKEHESSRKYS